MQERGFPIVPVVKVLLQIAAIIVLVFAGYILAERLIEVFSYWKVIRSNGRASEAIVTVCEFMIIFFGLPSLLWAIGDGLGLLREINYHAKLAVADKLPAPEPTTWQAVTPPAPIAPTETTPSTPQEQPPAEA